jgi:lipopolysaccharide biosynthesis glycosyltransferase
MVSAIENNKEHEIEFIIIYSKLSDENINKLNSINNCKLRFLQVDENIFTSLPLSHWVTVQAWFRIKLPDMCQDLDKILYLDCDTLILGNLEELFNTNLEGKYFAGVKDVWGVDKYCKRLNMHSGVYVNSGMLLFNAKYCREEKFFEKIVEFASNNAKIIEFCDQDSINKIGDENKVVLHPKFNFMDTWWRGGYYEFDGQEEQEYLEAKENPVIAHLTGLKPAFKGCGNKFKERWWEYAKQTNIYDELIKDYENSKEPTEPLKDKIFSIKNRYEGKVKIKILTILGIHIVLSRKGNK